MSTAISISLPDSTGTSVDFPLVAKDNGYVRWEAPGVDGKLSQATRVALKSTAPSNRDDESVAKNRLLLTKPRFDADGVAITPLFIDCRFDTPNGATALEKADIYAFLDAAVSEVLIKNQISGNDMIV